MQAKKPSIFISYRRLDTADAAGRIYDQLERALGEHSVFKDVDNMPLGVDFRSHVLEVIAASDIFLLLIGRHWTQPGPSGRSRLWDPDDLVRIEVEAGLETGVLIVPTLVSGAAMPHRDELPPSIQAIADLHAATIRQDPDFRKDMARLIAFFEAQPQPRAKRVLRRRPAPADARTTPLPRAQADAVTTTPAAAAPRTGRVAVIGIGGAGCRFLSHMSGAEVREVHMVAMDTDAETLESCTADDRVQLGPGVSAGTPAEAHVEIGRAAAEDSLIEIGRALRGYDLLFVVAGMGGGTGSGAAPVVARVARDMGKLCVALVTTPFNFEGRRRTRAAERSIGELAKTADAVVVAANQRLFTLADKDTTFRDAFEKTNGFLVEAIRSLSGAITNPGNLPVEFAQLASFLSGFGKAKVGASSTKFDAAGPAVRKALTFEFMRDADTSGATKALVVVTTDRPSSVNIDIATSVARHLLPEKTQLLVCSALDPAADQRARVSIWLNEPG